MIKTYFIRRVEYDQSGEIDWSVANSLYDFQNPWANHVLDYNSPAASSFTTFKALWSHEYLYIRFDVNGTDILTFRKKNEKLEVMMSDRVEIFFMSQKDMSPYYCLEIDSFGRVLDYEANHYRKFDFSWSWPHLEINASRKENGYSVIGMISMASMNKLKIIDRRVIRAGVYRGHCIRLTEEEAEFKWTCWADPGTITPDFHVPESFGMFILQP